MIPTFLYIFQYISAILFTGFIEYEEITLLCSLYVMLCRYMNIFHRFRASSLKCIREKEVGCKNTNGCLTRKNKAAQSSSIASIIKKTTYPTGSKWGAKLATGEQFIKSEIANGIVGFN